MALGVTAVMTWASYRLVETPFRTVRTAKRPRGMLLYPAAVSVAVACCLAATSLIDRQLEGQDAPISADDYERTVDGSRISDDPWVGLVQASVRAAAAERRIPRDIRPELRELKDDRADLGDCEYIGTPTDLCPAGDLDADRTMVVLGNSHGRHWIPAFDRIAEQAGWRTYYLVKSQCTPARVQMVRGGGKVKPWQGCLDFNAWAEDRVRELDPELVVVSTSGAPNVEVDGEVERSTDGVVAELEKGFDRLFADLLPLTKRLVLLEDVPRRTISPERCLAEKDAHLGTCLSGTAERADRVTRKSIEAADRAGVEVVPTRQWFCDDGRCPAVVADMVAQRDEGHVTTTYARSLTTPLGRALGLCPRRGAAGRARTAAARTAAGAEAGSGRGAQGPRDDRDHDRCGEQVERDERRRRGRVGGGQEGRHQRHRGQHHRRPQPPLDRAVAPPRQGPGDEHPEDREDHGDEGDARHRDRLATRDLEVDAGSPGEARDDGVERRGRHRGTEPGDGETPAAAHRSPPSAGRRSGSPSDSNRSAPKMVTSVTRSPATRSTSIVSGRCAACSSLQR